MHAQFWLKSEGKYVGEHNLDSFGVGLVSVNTQSRNSRKVA
jgi:hypothetical protein